MSAPLYRDGLPELDRGRVGVAIMRETVTGHRRHSVRVRLSTAYRVITPDEARALWAGLGQALEIIDTERAEDRS